MPSGGSNQSRAHIGGEKGSDGRVRVIRLRLDKGNKRKATLKLSLTSAWGLQLKEGKDSAFGSLCSVEENMGSHMHLSRCPQRVNPASPAVSSSFFFCGLNTCAQYSNNTKYKTEKNALQSHFHVLTVIIVKVLQSLLKNTIYSISYYQTFSKDLSKELHFERRITW